MRPTSFRPVLYAGVALLCGVLAAPPVVSADSAALSLAKKCRKTVSKQARTYAKKRLNFMLRLVCHLESLIVF